MSETVIAFQPDGEGIPLFLVTPGMEAVGLARAMGRERPLFGIRVPDLERFPELATIHELARFCARAILKARPEGPCALAGWCAAGFLALEIARELEREGKPVAFTAILDARSILPPMRPAKRLLVRCCRYYQRFRFWLARMVDEGWHPLRTAGTARLLRVRDRQRRRWRGLPRSHGDAVIAAMAGYHPLGWDGPMVHIWAAERPRGRFQDPQFLYGYFSPRGFAFYQVPGNHLSMFSERNLAALARIFESELTAFSPSSCEAVGDRAS